jgi:hypothetical protein
LFASIEARSNSAALLGDAVNAKKLAEVLKKQMNLMWNAM